MRVQLAIQGGGAKFINLLAAAEPFQKRHAAGTIRVTQVSGTSAGSIVAALVAMNASFERVNEFLNIHADAFVHRAVGKFRSDRPLRTYGRAMWHLYRGKPLVEPKVLREFLTNLICHALDAKAAPETIAAVRQSTGIKLYISASDMRSGAGFQFHERHNLLDALVASCAVPLLFRTYKDTEIPYVDGGLCDNLPVECLSTDRSEYGSIFAISPTDAVGPEATHVLSYVANLFNVAINHNVNRSKKLVGPARTIEFDTNLGTFDFNRMLLQRSNSEEYKNIRKKSTAKLVNYIRTIRAVASDDIEDGSYVNPYEMSRRFGGVMEFLKEPRQIEIVRSSTIVAGNCLAIRAEDEEEIGDTVRSTLEFKVTSGRVRLLEVNLHARGEVQRDISAWTLIERDSGEEVEATPFPLLGARDEKGRSHARTFLVLKHPIVGSPDGNVYSFSCSYVSPGALKGLAEGKTDFVSESNKSDTTYQQVDLVALIPNTFGKKVCPSIRPGDASLAAVRLTRGQLLSNSYVSTLAGFDAIGFRVSNLTPSSRQGLESGLTAECHRGLRRGRRGPILPVFA